MFRGIAKIATVLVLIASPSVQAANSWGTDMSDFWYNPSESGWGVNISHQDGVIFMAMFVYAADSSPKWYVTANGLNSQGGANSYVFSGPLHEARGSYFGGVFNPGNFNLRQVGTATVNLGVYQGTLSYSVDGVVVNKSITRQTFRNNNLAGNYIGATVTEQINCGSLGPSPGVFSVSHSGSAVSIAATFDNGGRCTYSATYSQTGRMGDMSGTFTCTNGARGSFRAFEIESSYQGFFARYTANYTNPSGCTETGRLGGMKY